MISFTDHTSSPSPFLPAMLTALPLLFFFLILGSNHRSLCGGENVPRNKKTYIVHMEKSQMPNSFVEHAHWYESLLKSVSNSAEMLYTYNTVMHGFSARLTEEEAAAMEGLPGTLSVLPEGKYELHTTRTPDFLGLDKIGAMFPDSVSDVIIGVLDTGVWPESKSYDDKGVGAIPSGWKGECNTSKTFSSTSCNKKLIGARFFSKGYEMATGPINETIESKSPRDDDGHGTHTSTTAAGSVVDNVSFFGFAAGTARGMATSARIAVYKVCWIVGSNCFDSDILAGMDKAIEDGVNVISMSIGFTETNDYEDVIAMGAYTAIAKGIIVSCSAGNAGPRPYSVSNSAPWIITVGAGTLDRDFPAPVTLGSGQNYPGASLYSGKPVSSSLLPVVYAGNATNATTNGALCAPNTLLPEKVAGKIVVCDSGGKYPAVEKGQVVKDAGGFGMILANTAMDGEELAADAYMLPATNVGQKSGDSIKSYLSAEANPTATIVFGGTKVGIQPSPVVAAFSSRGPSKVTQKVLKPDIIAPGVNILAGWSGGVSPTGLPSDRRRVGYNIISGTSMACPHISGIAALIKAAHPNWSPAAIKSALMTTAYSAYKSGNKILDSSTGKPATPFVVGSGHVDPVSALDPGLVYDITDEDYIKFLCSIRYTQSQIKLVTHKTRSCNSSDSTFDLNYPSFAAQFDTNMGFSEVKYTRTLTNVGTPGTYKVSLSFESKSVNISVEPNTLTFAELNEKKMYTLSFTPHSMPKGTNLFGRLEWSDGKHIVGCPIAFSWT